MQLKKIDLPEHLKLSAEQCLEVLRQLEKTANFKLRFDHTHPSRGLNLIEYFFKKPFEFFLDYHKLQNNRFYPNTTQKIKDLNRNELNFLFNSIKSVYPVDLKIEGERSPEFFAGKGMNYVTDLLEKLKAEYKIADSFADSMVLWNYLKKKIDPQKIWQFKPYYEKKSSSAALISKDQGDLFTFAEKIKREQAKQLKGSIELADSAKEASSKAKATKKKNGLKDIQGFLFN